MAKADGTTTPGASGANGDLAVNDGSLQSLKKQLDELLGELRNSPASHTDMRTATITSDAYGDFPGAKALSTQYAKVQARLEAFSQVLGEQIEALGISVEVSEKGYDNVEAETLRRMQEIQRNVMRQYQDKDAPPPQVDEKRTDRSTGVED